MKTTEEENEFQFEYCGLSRAPTPANLEGLRNFIHLTHPSAEYRSQKGYEYLRKARIDLVNARLTDKQMIAVSLVFYGNLRKVRAAQAMRITKQSLECHLKSALNKIERSLTQPF